ncbi:MAG: ABC transporter permease [Eggerthella lenta]
MAGIFTRFTLRSLAQNRVRTAVTVVGIALSTALLAAVLTSVASVQQGLLERTMVTEGSWHVFSPDVPAQGIDALVESDAVTDLATFRDLGSAALAPDDANRLGAFIALKTTPTTVKGVDEPGGAPYSLMPELASGRWPETADEIVLPDYLQGEELGAGGAEGVVSNGPLETGSTLTGGFGNLAAAEDGARLADGNETRVENARERTLTVTGFYKRQAPFLANNYTASSAPSVALTVADASEEGAAAGAYLVTQGLGTLDEMKAFFADATGLDDTAATLYHTSLFSYLGISDGRPIWGSLWAVAAVLAIVIVAASASLIYNAFAIWWPSVRSSDCWLSRRFERSCAAPCWQARCCWEPSACRLPLSGRGGHGRRRSRRRRRRSLRCWDRRRGSRCTWMPERYCGRGTVDSHLLVSAGGAVGPRRRLQPSAPSANAGRAPLEARRTSAASHAPAGAWASRAAVRRPRFVAHATCRAGDTRAHRGGIARVACDLVVVADAAAVPRAAVRPRQQLARRWERSRHRGVGASRLHHPARRERPVRLRRRIRRVPGAGE